MKVHFSYEDLPDSVNDKLLTLGEYWNLIPGFGFVEIIINNIKELYDIINDINVMLEKPVQVNISVLDKINDNDSEEMLLAVIKPRTDLF